MHHSGEFLCERELNTTLSKSAVVRLDPYTDAADLEIFETHPALSIAGGRGLAITVDTATFARLEPDPTSPRFGSILLPGDTLRRE